MKRSLCIALALVLLFAVAVQAQTESKAIIYGGGKVFFGEDKPGGGVFMGFGYRATEELIIWASYGNKKITIEKNPIETNEGSVGFSLMSDPILAETFGIFFRGEVGGVHLELTDTTSYEWMTLTHLGLYTNLDSKKKTQLWAGFGYHGIQTVKPIWSIDFGVSIKPQKWLW